MDHNETSTFTPFDYMTQTRELQMLKTMLPYMKDTQKKQFAILIKYMELQNTVQVFSQEDKVMSMCSVDEGSNNMVAMLNDLRVFCTSKEQECLRICSPCLRPTKPSSVKQKGIPMPYDFLNNNPLLADMSPEKLQFLMNFATAKKPTDIKEMMPFLLSAMNSAKSNNIQFSEPETDLLFQILKQNMSAEESAKADKIMNLMKNRRSGS